MKYEVASLFSGAGGLDLGFKEQGWFRIRMANEILPSPSKTYSTNFGLKLIDVKDFQRETKLPVILSGDIANVDLSLLKAKFDVLTGGPPCQDFSLVRGPYSERLGINVKRGKLYTHFMKALVALRPSVFLFENVPGLVTANSGLAYKTITNDLSDLEDLATTMKVHAPKSKLSYELMYNDLVRFKNLGVPQDRRRLIIIGLRRDIAKILGETQVQQLRLHVSSSLKGSQQLLGTYPLTPIEVFEGSILTDLQDNYHSIMKNYKGVWSEVGSESAMLWKKSIWDNMTFDVVKDYLRVNQVTLFSKELFDKAMKEHENILRELGYWHVSVPSTEDADMKPTNGIEVRERMYMVPPGENHEFVRGTKWAVEGRGVSLVYRRLHPLKPSYAMLAYGGGGTWGYHYERSRTTLSNRERARLQTFPDSFTWAGTASQIRAQVGEAVPPLAAKRLALVVFNIMRATLRRSRVNLDSFA